MDEYEFQVRAYTLLRHFTSLGSPLDSGSQARLREFLNEAPASVKRPGEVFFNQVFVDTHGG